MEVFTTSWNSRKYQIGYALSGGFIKGFAHLGVMQALLEHDVKPDIISGVSAGAGSVSSTITLLSLVESSAGAAGACSDPCAKAGIVKPNATTIVRQRAESVLQILLFFISGSLLII